MSSHLKLHLINTNVFINVEGSVHIGRASSARNWAVPNRHKPSVFADLEVVLKVQSCSTISRNHAAIYRQGEHFYLLDLNSCNGTYLNGEDVNPERLDPKPVRLRQGDNICLAEALEIRISRGVNSSRHGILVGAGNDNEGAASSDVMQLYNILEQRGYRGNLHTLIERQATKQRLYHCIEEVCRDAVLGSHLLFYFHGHGGAHGLYLGQDDRKIINPKQLYNKLSRFRGKKAIILDSCNAGYFLSDKAKKYIPENTLVIVSSGEQQDAKEAYQSAIAQYGGRFTRLLIKFFEQEPVQDNLADFKHFLQQEVSKDAVLYYQAPHVTGQSFTLIQTPANSDDVTVRKAS